MLYSNTDITVSVVPINKNAIPIIVYGIEKYLVSLNVIATIAAKIIPNVVKMIPGIPINLRGDFIAMISKSDITTSPECDTGFFVDVSLPVSYITETFSSSILNPFFAASIKISASAPNPLVPKLIFLITLIE